PPPARWGRSPSSGPGSAWRGSSPDAPRKGFPRMWLESLEWSRRADGPLHRLDPRAKLVATLAYVVAAVATPVGSWRLLAAEGLLLAFVVGLSGVSPRDLGRRWLAFLLLVGFLGVMVALSHPRRDAIGVAGVALAIVAKN